MHLNDQTRRLFMRIVAASGAATALGTTAVAGQENDDAPSDPYEGIPVAGNFPEGETVGLRKVAEDLPAPTDYQYVEDADEDRHFVTTQTGQIYAFDPVAMDEADDAEDAADDEDGAEEEEDETDGEVLDVGEILVDGHTRAWIGRDPPEIEGEENPTLRLAEGETYTITWENVDGAPHNVEIWDEDEAVVDDYQTEIVGEEGATQSLEFTATAEMAEYVCVVHPNTMAAPIEVVEDDEVEPDAPGVPTPDDMDLFLDLEDRLVDLGIRRLGDYDERGLFNVAFHPDYDETGMFYVRYSSPAENAELVDVPEEYDHVDVLSEFQVDDDADVDDTDDTETDDAADDADADDDADEAGADQAEVDLDTERRILEVPMPQDNHNGGQLAFDDDGYLLTSYGDGGNFHDIGPGHVDDWYDENEGGNGQDTQENLLGGIQRIDVEPRDDADVDDERADEGDDDADASAAQDDDDDDVVDEDDGVDDDEDVDDLVPDVDTYTVPDDNPLVDTEHLGEYYAWGFRNPWGMSLDDDGQLFVADAGQHAVESIYTVEAGGNYGWNVKEGSFCFSPATPTELPEECPDVVDEDVPEPRGGEPLRDPIAEYQHVRITEGFVDSSVVVGGHRYAGDELDVLDDEYVFANWSAEGIVDPDGELLVATEPEDDDAEDGDAADDFVEVDQRWDLEELQVTNAPDQSINRYVYSVERDEDGELYVLTNSDFRPFPETGEIFRIVPEEEGEEVPEPEDPAVVDPDQDADGDDAETGEADDDENAGDDGDEDAEDDGDDDF